METAVRISVDHYNVETGEVLESHIVRDDNIIKPTHLKELGYLHLEQIEIVKSVQDFKIKHQSALCNQTNKCPKCGERTQKQGIRKSKFHAALTDHEVYIQRKRCICGWSSPYTIEGIYGCSLHPDLLEKQAKQGADNSYRKSSCNLNAESNIERSVNSVESIRKNSKKVAKVIGNHKLKSEKIPAKKKAAKQLLATIDGGHVKSNINGSRSFEAMIAAVYRPENIKQVDKNHNEIIQKTCVASALSDKQKTIKALVLNACRKEGMHSKVTELTCLADGANNCWSIANVLKPYCKTLTNILDWFHVTKRFTVILNSIENGFKERLEKVKWHLWHGDYKSGLKKLQCLANDISSEKTLANLDELYSYIDRNRKYLANYQERKSAGLHFTSTMAESTVDCLINTRQKRNQKMQWSREGAHDILQIRTSIFSKSWEQDWEDAQGVIYKEAA